jgi:hypothetical protein
MLQHPTCEHCDKPLPLSKHTGRRRRFCSPQCRVAEFRYNRDAGTYQGIECNETRYETSAKSTTCKRDFRGRGIDLRGVDRDLAERILVTELPRLRRVAP